MQLSQRQLEDIDSLLKKHDEQSLDLQQINELVSKQ